MKYQDDTHPEGQSKSYHQYITKTQVGNKNIGDTFTFHKMKNCDEDKNVSCEKKTMMITC